MIAFAAQEVTPLQKRVALGVALGILLAAIAIAPQSMRPARWLFFDSATTVAQVATAVLLFGRFWQNRYLTTLLVACGFFFLALISIREQLALSGLIVAANVDGFFIARLLWLTAVAQLGFPLFILAATMSYLRRNDRVLKAYVLVTGLAVVIATILLAGVAISLVSASQNAIAALFDADGGVYKGSSLVPPLAITLSACGALLYLAATRGRTLEQLWISVALLANIAYVVFVVVSGGEFVVAWYAAHYFALLAASLIPAVHLYESNVLHGRLEALNEVLQQQALFDELTGVGNRRMFDNRLLAEWKRSTRSGVPISLVIMDVDHFKMYNDAYGHQRGDKCLAAVARTVSTCVARPTDVVTRYGGEEFAVILPGTGEAAALEIAERMRAAVERLHLTHATSPVSTYVTLSLGTASCVPGRGARASGLIQAADAALYKAKSAGRNRVLAADGVTGLAPQAAAGDALYDWQRQ